MRSNFGAVTDSLSGKTTVWNPILTSMVRHLAVLVFIVSFLFSGICRAETLSDPIPMTYRGEVTTNGEPMSGSVDLRFHLYSGLDPNSSEPIETEELFGVELIHGRFEVELEFESQSAASWFGSNWRRPIRVTFTSSSPSNRSDQTLSPRRQCQNLLETPALRSFFVSTPQAICL